MTALGEESDSLSKLSGADIFRLLLDCLLAMAATKDREQKARLAARQAAMIAELKARAAAAPLQGAPKLSAAQALPSVRGGRAKPAAGKQNFQGSREVRFSRLPPHR